jgi:hypothetical protein
MYEAYELEEQILSLSLSLFLSKTNKSYLVVQAKARIVIFHSFLLLCLSCSDLYITLSISMKRHQSLPVQKKEEASIVSSYSQHKSVHSFFFTFTSPKLVKCKEEKRIILLSQRLVSSEIGSHL